MLHYDYVIIGAGISGCCVAHELAQHNKNILLIDQNKNVASGASGAAGAFLSPLLGKSNPFKDLVTNSLKYSTNFYQSNFPKYFNNCGTTRIPKNEIDESKFEDYIPFMDFDFLKDDEGYFFEIGSVVDSFNMCQNILSSIASNVVTKFGYKVNTLEYINDIWLLNDEVQANKVIFTTGSDVELLDQFYLKIRPVWGQRIDISTSTSFTHNYHKSCSISQSKKIEEDVNFVSIGATHHRDVNGIEDIDENTNELLKKANDIKVLKNVNVISHFTGARACSIDYFPILGDIIDGKRTLEEFPYLVNGTHVEAKRFTRFKDAYIFTGVGGRGFVLAPYLAKVLVENIVNGTKIDKSISTDRLFQREVKRYKIEISHKG